MQGSENNLESILLFDIVSWHFILFFTTLFLVPEWIEFWQLGTWLVAVWFEDAAYWILLWLGG